MAALFLLQQVSEGFVNPTTISLGVIAILILILLVFLSRLHGMLSKWIDGSQKPNDDHPLEPRDPICHCRTLSLDPKSKRWQLLDANGELAPPIVVRGGDTINYHFDFSNTAVIHLQFPINNLFTNFPSSVDPWVTVTKPGNLVLTVARDLKLLDPHLTYAIYIQDDELGPQASTGFVQGGSPPRIKVEGA
ncbi:MAG: hypothetical protein AB8G77_01815 [Rhodothermales bacterium]